MCVLGVLILEPLFDTNDVSGVHISSAGEEKLCEIFSKYLTVLPGKSEFPVNFGKVCFILEIACVAVILIWSLSSLFLVTSFVPRHKITFPMCVLGVLILEVAKLIHCSTLSSVAPDTSTRIYLKNVYTCIYKNSHIPHDQY
jgi:hypothetical protein